jgi:hypothetical protein
VANRLTTTAKADKIEFLHDEGGYNYRLTNILAALGVAQLEKLKEYVEAKRNIARRYAALFADCDEIHIPPEPAECQSTFWMYTVRLNRPARPVIDRLIEHGIMARPIWVPLHRLPAFKNEFNVGYTVADDLYTHAISLPCSVSLSENEIATVARQLTLAINEMPEVIDQNSRAGYLTRSRNTLRNWLKDLQMQLDELAYSMRDRLGTRCKVSAHRKPIARYRPAGKGTRLKTVERSGRRLQPRPECLCGAFRRAMSVVSRT